MVKKLTTQNEIIIRDDGRCYDSPAHVPRIASCDISGSVDVGVYGMSASLTLQESRMSNSIPASASVTLLGCVGGIDINNPASFSESLVFYKLLKFIESPLVNPFIVSGTFSDSRQILHNNNITLFDGGNNRRTDIVVCPSHKPSPSSRKFSKLLSGTSRAFGLELADKSVSTLPKGFNFVTIKIIPRSDSESIDSQVHPKNFGMLVRSFGAFLGECKSEVMFAFKTFGQKTFNKIPFGKIFRGIFGNLDRNLDTSSDSGNAQNIIFKREGARRVISDANLIDDRRPAFTFQYTASHLNTGDSQLGSQSDISQININEGMEFDVVGNTQFSSIIDAILKPLLIQIDCIDYIAIDFNLDGNASNQHARENQICYLNLSEEYGIPPNPKGLGILPNFI